MASPQIRQPKPTAFADYCCELLASVGPCERKRMFGGFGISTGGLSIAWVLDLGGGETLWLKGNEETRGLYEAAGCSGLPIAPRVWSAASITTARQMTRWSRLSSWRRGRGRPWPVR